MRHRACLDDDWRFALGHAADPSRDFEFARDRSLVKSGEARGAAGVKFDDSGWRRVDLPHDWAIELPLVQREDREFCEHGFHAIGPDYPENSVGWYRKRFSLSQWFPDKPGSGQHTSAAGRSGSRAATPLRHHPAARWWIEFDGVFRDSVVWLNGHRLGRHASGYTPFRFDVTDLIEPSEENVLVVRADATSYEGWWYEGAGIYRHVWLLRVQPLHVASTFVTSVARAGAAWVTARTMIRNDAEEVARFTLSSEVLDPAGQRVARVRSRPLLLAPFSSMEIAQKLRVRNPRLWSCEDPALYRLRSTLDRGRGVLTDEHHTTFGIRSIRWDARRGFFLNGRHLKIKGTCNHQQHAGVGIAVPDALWEWRLNKLKEMGSNAIRCSHYMVAPEVLDICDRLGLLVMAENRLADVGPQFLADFETMILRDRNHPSIILWSIGNEEHTIQWSEAGERIGRTLVRTAHRLDPTRKVTAAMHDRGLGAGFANVVDVHGWNYIHVGDIEAFHRRRPDQPIIGSEEGSTVTTRGEYADDPERGYVSAYDRRHPKWGSTAQKWWKFFAERD
ncbi:MAG: beta-galactosidase, partial [Phycisphaerae bacterium]|nr:beta-galactosidase [Phycisphaerae bacterium]